jgi:anti-sigma B factor antagonist
MFVVPDGGTNEVRTVGLLQIRSFRDGEQHVVALTGELDIASVAEVDRCLEEVEAGGAKLIVLDLSALEFMDSCGLQLLLVAHRRDDRLVIVRGPRAVQRVVQICGLDDQLPFVDVRPSPRPDVPPFPPLAPAIAHPALAAVDPPADAARAAVVRRAKQAAMSNAVRQLRSRDRRPLRAVPKP